MWLKPGLFGQLDVCVLAGLHAPAAKIDPIWCSSVSGPRELNNLNPGASPYLNYFNWGRELNNLNNLNPGGGGLGGEARGR